MQRDFLFCASYFCLLFVESDAYKNVKLQNNAFSSKKTKNCQGSIAVMAKSNSS